MLFMWNEWEKIPRKVLIEGKLKMKLKKIVLIILLQDPKGMCILCRQFKVFTLV